MIEAARRPPTRAQESRSGGNSGQRLSEPLAQIETEWRSFDHSRKRGKLMKGQLPRSAGRLDLLLQSRWDRENFGGAGVQRCWPASPNPAHKAENPSKSTS